MTRDADIATSLDLRTRGRSIAELLREAGFSEHLKGEDTPPIAEYHLGEEDGGFYAEFLVPLAGSGTRRNGAPDDTATVSGVSAQKLRHIDLLITSPWKLRLADGNGFPLGEKGLEILVPNPACFIAQKLLVMQRRQADKRSKDILYIHDTLLLFSEALEKLEATWAAVAQGLPPNTLAALHEARERYLGTVNDHVRKAAQIAASTGRANPPTPERLIAVCRLGMATIFGT
ncbi:MAG: nucleotidyltransferase domain-containing protein [Myxococcaceae bacterium]|nr:nucleotidyltransferase domain-containing protein [Myxococcaceae bacterium]MCI0673810.1 nucleotidyltransferase domain-containing protein [Myxococcaceae bacterium]